MAKWGEGDPRWIVEEREDAKNPNNWHWTEKNATQWSITKIKSLLTKLEVITSSYKVKITEVTKCEGEAIINNRKGKLIFFYEWDIKAKWVAKSTKDEKIADGTLEIPNLSEENSADDLDVMIITEGNDKKSLEVKDELRSNGTTLIKNSLDCYIKELKHEFGKNLILPTKNSPSQQTNGVKSNEIKEKMNNYSTNLPKTVSSNVTSFKKTEKFLSCSVEDLFLVFTDEQRLQAFTRGPVVIDFVENGSYELWNGNISGNFISIKKEDPREISMTWRKKIWPKDVFSKVTLKFAQQSDGVDLTLEHTDIPVDQLEDIQNGWANNYFNPIRGTFNYGGLF